MKKTIFMTLLIVLIVAIPVAAAPRELVGEQISVFTGQPTEFPAGDPFHIVHGWVVDPSLGPPGRFGFQLEIDGVVRDYDFKMTSVDRDAGPEWLLLQWAHNFPDGMTGTHTFTGRWYAPCRYAVEMMGYPGPCPQPSLTVEAEARDLTVEFLEP